MKTRFRTLASYAGAVGAVTLGMAACSVQENLLELEQPQIISPADAANPTGAVALATGAIGYMKIYINNISGIWQYTAVFTDEMKSGDTNGDVNSADQRDISPNTGTYVAIWNGLQQSRGRFRDGVNALRQYAPLETAKLGEMYLGMGFVEMTLGQNWCNGIPLGETVLGVPQYTAPLTNAQVFGVAIARFDTALTVLNGTDALSLNIRNAVLVAKARAQVDLGQFAAAAATAAAVPTNSVYLLTYLQTSMSNGWWTQVTNNRRMTVGDSFDVAGVIKNALPFASANDPRVKVNRSTIKSFDGSTPFVDLLNWGREDPIPMVSGLDARLVEAEAKLQLNDFAGMMAILNALRAAPPKLGNFTPTVMAPLAVPATATAAVTLFFREKAFWQFGRGERMSDLRRLVRQYGRSQEFVFPSGVFFKNNGLPYGSQVSIPIGDQEKTNTNFLGCIDNQA